MKAIARRFSVGNRRPKLGLKNKTKQENKQQLYNELRKQTSNNPT